MSLGRITAGLRALLRDSATRLTTSLLSVAPPVLLVGMARALAHTRPYGLYPGWKFAVEEDRPTWDVEERLRLWQIFRDRHIERPVRVRWYDGLVVDLTLGNDMSRCLYVSGSFEPNEFCFLGSVLRPGAQFVDIGANEGFYTLFAARRVGPQGRVYAFEPSPRERARLDANIEANKLRNVTVFGEGLAEQEGRAVLHLAEAEHSGQNTLGAFGYPGVDLAADVQVDLTTLDQLRDSGRVARVDVVKMDVEGAEMRVLRGALRTLQHDRPIMMFELFDAALRGQGSSADEVVDFLRGHGFDLYQFDTQSGEPVVLRTTATHSTNIIAFHPQGGRVSGWPVG
jgi:FkbM family methyltransferase